MWRRGITAASDGDSPPRHSVDIDRLRPQVVAFCGDCHAAPPPESFPRSAWYDEVERGYQFYFESGRTDLTPPAMQDVVAFYRRQAPETLELTSAMTAEGPPPATFATQSLDRANEAPPAVAFARWITLASGAPPGLLTCDMRLGEVRWAPSLSPSSDVQTLVRLDNPCRVEPCDLDGDGRVDLLVSDLGSFLPEDHDRGRVVWLRRGEADRWETRVIADALGRVADARPADFDGDGDQDVIVAEFGWRNTGGIHLLENRGGEFDASLLDPRPGAIHVPVCDLNDDGKPDFVALISQHYETIVAFLNEGNGRFSQRTLWSADDPGFGSSGIELVDLDQDGDLDVLYTNGDTFDSAYLKPSHGVHWLENRGGVSFVAHRLATLPGVYRALPADVDGDGDWDIIATTFLPQFAIASIDPAELDSVVLLEQTASGKFAYHQMERGKPEHAAMAVADFDGDGDVDFAVGVQVGAATEPLPRVVLWWNQRKP